MNRVAHQARPKRRLTRLDIAIRIRETALPALSNPALFTYQPQGPYRLWISKSFHLASLSAPSFTSFEVWPIKNNSGLAKHYDADDKAMNLHHSDFGTFELISFRSGDWQEDLLRYIDASLGY